MFMCVHKLSVPKCYEIKEIDQLYDLLLFNTALKKDLFSRNRRTKKFKQPDNLSGFIRIYHGRAFISFCAQRHMFRAIPREILCRISLYNSFQMMLRFPLSSQLFFKMFFNLGKTSILL